MTKRICKICGNPEEDHHEPEYITIPAGCVCEIMEWNLTGKTAMPPVCESYKGTGNTHCDNCEHDKECHATPDSSQRMKPACKAQPTDGTLLI